MHKELIYKKNRLLKKIPKESYRSLVRYMEAVFLADYDLKVFMARKFSNLFFAMLPLVEEEEGGRVHEEYKLRFSGKRQPVMISNIALPAWKEKIQKGECKKILLADDIIIHGRSLDEVYRQIKGWFEEKNIKDYKIDVFAYAESETGLLEGVESLEHRVVQKVCTEGEWRVISDRIVASLYLLGQPYTSYVPNMRIKGDSEFGKYIQGLLSDGAGGFLKQENADMQMYNANTYVYVSPQEHELALSFSVRIYEYVDLYEYVFVPMVMLAPVGLQVLEKYLEELKVLVRDGAYRGNISDEAEGGFSYRLAVYLVSALRGWKFIRERLQFQGQIPSFDKREEEVNFASVILKEEMESLPMEGMDGLWSKLCGTYEPAARTNDVFSGEKDIVELDDKFTATWDNIGKLGKLDSFFGNFLYVNGQMDEQCCREAETGVSQRLLGYPVAKVAERMKEWNAAGWVRAVLNAIDYGKGSIVSKVLEGHCFSVIHAGELNNKYYLNGYFPFLYGLNYIESQARREGWAPRECKERRKEFLDAYKKYWKGIGRDCFDSDIDEMESMPVSKKFNEVLENMAWNYLDDGASIECIKIAKEIVGAKDKAGADGLSTNL